MILSRLAEDARVKNKDLAKHLGIAPSTCLERIRRLERFGYIVGYRAIVARSGAGGRLEGWADIRLFEPTPDLTRRFIHLVTAAPEIVEAHRIAGKSDYVVRFCAGDMEAWNVFRKSLDALGCQIEARFSVLVEALK